MNRIRYFAVFREQAGKDQEDRNSLEKKSLNQLYQDLKTEYGFTLSIDQVKFVVNQTYEQSSYTIKPSDEIVFIPPIAGG